MKRSHLILCLGALTVAFLPLTASAGTTTTAASNTTATKSAAATKTTEANKSILPHHHAKAAAARTPKMDLNTASREELMTLPGVDGATADKIISNRPYKNMHELTSKSVVSKSEYTKIRRKVTAK